ncbi:MAG TPA: methyltransferase domain-containing protein [Micromonosporaceae bacterium]
MQSDQGGRPLVAWSLEQAYDAYPRIEEQFEADLDVSPSPRGSNMLFELVANMKLARGAVALDVGSGEGAHAMRLAERFGLRVTGIDPVARHIAVAQAAARDIEGAAAPDFVLGTVEQLPIDDATVDLLWCRDVLVHVEDLAEAYREIRRVLKPRGRALIYQMFAGPNLEPGEAAWLWTTMGVVPASADPAPTEAAIAASGLCISERIDLGSEWGEFAQEASGRPGRKLLHAARLQRQKDTFVDRYGQAAYDMMLGDCLWHVYAMIGKLVRRVYLLSAPAELDGSGPGRATVEP